MAKGRYSRDRFTYEFLVDHLASTLTWNNMVNFRPQIWCKPCVPCLVLALQASPMLVPEPCKRVMAHYPRVHCFPHTH